MAYRGQSMQHVPALVALVLLLAGVGGLGWLVAHVLTYDAMGQSHLHGTHGYMQPLELVGSAATVSGVLLVLLSLLVGRRALVDWVHNAPGARGAAQWFVAAAVPALGFLAVEGMQGFTATPLLLVLGIPAQAIAGVLVLAAVRALVLLLAGVVELLVGSSPRPPRHSGTRSVALAPVRIDLPRPRAMATNAARRGPPGAMP